MSAFICSNAFLHLCDLEVFLFEEFKDDLYVHAALYSFGLLALHKLVCSR